MPRRKNTEIKTEETKESRVLENYFEAIKREGSKEDVPTQQELEPYAEEIPQIGEDIEDKPQKLETKEADEEKTVVVDPLKNGWYPMDIAPKVGIQLLLSEDGISFIRGQWYRTRHACYGKWTMSGWWVNSVSLKKLDFEPKYWRSVW